MSASISRSNLSDGQSEFIQSLATLAYGHGFREGAKGGVGNMGLAMIGGKLRVFKCNTHRGQVKTAAEDAEVELVQSSNRLREVLESIGKDAGFDQPRLDEMLGVQGAQGQTPLLTRKIVAKFVAAVTGEVKPGGRGTTWGEAERRSRGMVSVDDMNFATMVRRGRGRMSVVNGYGRYTLEAERGALSDVVLDALSKTFTPQLAGMETLYRQPDAINVRFQLVRYAERLSGEIISTSLSANDLRTICDTAERFSWFKSLKKRLETDNVDAEGKPDKETFGLVQRTREAWVEALRTGDNGYEIRNARPTEHKQAQIFDALVDMIAGWVVPANPLGL